MKSEILSVKPETNSKTPRPKRFDLEDRTLRFAKEVRDFVARLPKNTGNQEDGKQLIRSSGSVGANYLEANQSLSKKDFLMRVKIAKKEARETIYWLELVQSRKADDEKRMSLLREATEIMNILGAIVRNST